MQWLGQLAQDGTMSIYQYENQKEVACVYQEEKGDTTLFRIEAKNFLYDNHVEDYKIWLKMIVDYMKSNYNTRDRKVSFVSIQDKDFDAAIEELYPELPLCM